MILLLALLGAMVLGAVQTLRIAASPDQEGIDRLLMGAVGIWITGGAGALAWLLLGAPN